MVIVRKYVRKLVLALNHYSDRNGEAWYLVNNIRERVSEVERNLDVLAYPVRLSKRGKSSVELFYEALRDARPSSHYTTQCCPILRVSDVPPFPAI
ncbi:unnamed protein product [Lepidochelys kempii]